MNKNKIKIIYDISTLGAGYMYERARTGVFRVAENLLIGLNKLKQIDLFLSCIEKFYYNGVFKYIEESNNVRMGQFISLKSVFFLNLNKLHYGLINTSKNKNIFFRVPRKVLTKLYVNMSKVTDNIYLNSKLKKYNIFHSPFLPIPEFINKNKKIKKVLTVYDLIPIIYPQFFTKEILSLFNDIIKSISQDTWITCISHSTKNDLCSQIKNIDPDKIIVTPLGASENFYYCKDGKKINEIKKKYNIPLNSTYVLSLCTLEPRKNIISVIKAFSQLIEQEKIEDLFLVLVGPKGWNYDSIFLELKNNIRMKDKIILTGFIPDEDLSPLYSGASSFIFPSFYEGFGLPVLEAMKCGVPIITSNTSSLPELVGDAGVMVDPEDIDMQSQWILNIYKDSKLKQKMSEKSIARAKCFSWDICINKTLELYKKSLS